MGGPIFGASGKINLAYYDALKSMSKMCSIVEAKDTFSMQAQQLKECIVSHLWNKELGIMRMSDITSPVGICQDINAYGITTGVSPEHTSAVSNLAAPEGTALPVAFQNIERWDQKKVVSPYASGFAAEALFECGNGSSAIELVERVWGVMADETNPNYSGGHWEAMKPDGTPITDDTSLMHGWSTWPVYLLPRYLGGVEPLEAGWSHWKVKPVLANLDTVDIALSTPAGKIKVSLQMEERLGTGRITLNVPVGSVAEVFPPTGWIIITSEKIEESIPLEFQKIAGQEQEVVVKICRVHGNSQNPLSVPSEKNCERENVEEIEETEEDHASGKPKKQQRWYGSSAIYKRLHRWLI
jgi:alpha-L-rhamnosidase